MTDQERLALLPKPKLYNGHLPLGKKAPRFDRRTLKMSKYMAGVTLPSPPKQGGYYEKVASWPMMLNDSLGDCTIACAGHMIEQWSTYTGKPFIPTDAEILTAYEAVSGYVPGDESTDNGADILTVMNYWRQTGIGGDKIAAFVSVNQNDPTEVKLAVELFGNCYLGVGLPITAQQPVLGWKGLPFWDVPAGGTIGNGAPYSWGGHAIPIVDYGVTPLGKKRLMVVTWGSLYTMSPAFLDTYGDEAYAVLSQDWIAEDGESPSGFDTAQLLADLAAIY